MIISMDKKYVTRDGEYEAQVVSIRDANWYQKGELPVSAVLKHKLNGKVITIQYSFYGQFSFLYNTHPLDLIEVSEVQEDERGDWIKFDAENDEVPFLHMHDMVEVKYGNGHQSPPVPAWSVDFDTTRDPVVAYRLVTKAEQPEKKFLPIEVFVDVAEAAENKVVYANFGSINAAREAGVRAVLELAGVKV